MEKLLLFLFVIFSFNVFSASGKSFKVSVVDRPDSLIKNINYVSNRYPLIPSAFIKLPVGSIKPQGWLLECLNRQRDGLNGHLDDISAWLQKNDNAWLSKTGEGAWGWEEVPYWLKGFGDLGYLLGDSAMIGKSAVWIEGVLNSQRPNGDFGPKHFSNGNRNFWGNMVMLYCLQSYYEYSKDQRVIDLMVRFFKFQLSIPDKEFLKGYWEGLRGGDNLYSVFWLYNRTGEKFLIDLAQKIHRCMPSWTSRHHTHKAGNHPKKNNPEWYNLLPDWHNVNVAQGFREPAQYFQLSKDSTDLKASYDVFNIIRQFFGQVPGGMFGADEVARPGYYDPHQAIETCGLVEQMNSDEHLLRITGDPFWADHTENVAFNMYPASLTKDMKALRYFTAPNMVVCDEQNHSPGIMNSGPFFMMNPFSSRCCQHNHGQGWPYYAENLWMATPDNGAFAALYAASEAKILVGEGSEVIFHEITKYPFEEDVLMRLSMKKAVRFPLYLRIPQWCSGASVELNGKKIKVTPEPGKIVRIERKWNNGDRILLNLPMEVSVQQWEKNKNSISVNYGPLTFSLKIEEKYIEKPSDQTAIGDSRWQSGVDKSKWPSWTILPESDWNYGFVLDENNPSQSFYVEKKDWPKDNFPFTLDNVPISIKAWAKKIPGWTIDKHGLCGELPESPVFTDQPTEEVELIPMGAARLRLSAIPIAK
ncbi:beta-L-arabinofuranosidase domain-containing protein [Thermophagus sp. OGC60D27]|uniref:beta-L-arabinofuranosidase domain-containing protein n=1 Tax=Thermophagus sp. OGC60D27 TaxID=3458415 RepID=UPI004037D6E8